MEYTTLFFILFAVIVAYKMFTFVIKTIVKVAFTAAFLALIVMVMSSSVGLM